VLDVGSGGDVVFSWRHWRSMTLFLFFILASRCNLYPHRPQGLFPSHLVHMFLHGRWTVNGSSLPSTESSCTKHGVPNTPDCYYYITTIKVASSHPPMPSSSSLFPSFSCLNPAVCLYASFLTSFPMTIFRIQQWPLYLFPSPLFQISFSP